MKLLKSEVLFIFVLLVNNLISQSIDVPKVYSDLLYDAENKLYYKLTEGYIPEYELEPYYTLEKFVDKPKGTKTGLSFNFKDKSFHGTMYYGFIPYNDSKHPYPVYFKLKSAVEKGEATIDILNNLAGKYDMISWQSTGKGTIGYRIVDEKGVFIYDGKVSFKGTGPFDVDYTILEGPFVNLVTPEGATISFKTNAKVMASVLVDGKEFFDQKKTSNHEILIKGLQPGTEYKYTVILPGGNKQTFWFSTAPPKGSREPFVFAYCSDSRNAMGGGERNLYGTNYYILKKIMALSTMMEVEFLQFSGDLIDGYLLNEEEMDLQYANWKRALEPFWHYFPVYAGMGNHEVLLRAFLDTTDRFIRINKFPFDEVSSEAVFARNFVNPVSTLQTEDGAYYDPDEKNIDFPTYRENVFYYTYANVAMVVLNSNYLFAPDLPSYPNIGGNLHGYIMDNQLAWLEETIAKFEEDSLIDHVFVTLHTPAFPNGGHVADDMWYNGNNEFRPYIAGKPVNKGIIERRDEFLQIIVNNSTKVAALLTGDEHNYNRLRICEEMPRYPENWDKPELILNREIIQINNGAAGAPYYAQEKTPWSDFVSNFTTQNALVLIYVDGKKIRVKVLNPDTLEKVDEYYLVN